MEDRDYPEYDSDDNFIGWGPKRHTEYKTYPVYNEDRPLFNIISCFIESISPKEEEPEPTYKSIAPPLVYPGQKFESEEKSYKWEDDPDDNYWFDTEEEFEPIKQIEPVEQIEPAKVVEPVKNWSKMISSAPTVVKPTPVIRPPPVVYNKHNKQPPKSKNQKKYNNYDEDDDSLFEYYSRKGESAYTY